jgi:luciferase family oxidoreductase group 1
MIPFSVLDLAPVAAGATPAQALRNSLELAQHVERWGYRRYWVAEHHSMPGIASAATSVAIGYLAGGTSTIESLYPGRIDLGLGRAPGTDMATTRALRRDSKSNGDDFPQQVEELQSYFAPAVPGQKVRAVPGSGLHVPIWLLGSSLFSAQLAAALGLPFAFASHFAPADLMQAVQLYRAAFRASAQLKRPYVALGINVFAADTDDEARRLFTSHQQAFVMLRRGTPGQIPAPIDDIDAFWTPAEQAMASQSLLCTAVGSAATVERKLQKFIEVTEPDELLVTGLMYNQNARLRSYEITAQVRQRISLEEKTVKAPVAV